MMLTSEQLLDKKLEKAIELLRKRDGEHLDLLIKNGDLEKRVRDLQTKCFKTRQLTRDEYKDVMHYSRLQDRSDSIMKGLWYHSELRDHVGEVWQAARDVKAGIGQRYKPASEAYDHYLMECMIGKYESDELKRIERHVGYYMNALANGYDAYSATEAAMDAIRHE